MVQLGVAPARSRVFFAVVLLAAAAAAATPADSVPQGAGAGALTELRALRAAAERQHAAAVALTAEVEGTVARLDALLAGEAWAEGVGTGALPAEDAPDASGECGAGAGASARLLASASGTGANTEYDARADRVGSSVRGSSALVGSGSGSGTDLAPVLLGGSITAGALSRRFRDTFGERFSPLAATALPARATALLALPQESTAESLSRYVAAGDQAGGAHLLRVATGELLETVSPPTFLPASVTGAASVLGAYVRRRNETVLLVGHAGGAVVAHVLREHVRTDAGGNVPDDLRSLSAAGHAYAMRSPMLEEAHADAEQHGSGGAGVGPDERARALARLRVSSVDAFKLGGTRVVAVAYAGGGVEIFGERGAPLASVSTRGERAVAMRASNGLLVYVAATHTGSVRINPLARPHAHAMPADVDAISDKGGDDGITYPLSLSPTPQELSLCDAARVSEAGVCRGLNGSALVAARFDSLTGPKMFALSDTGDLLSAIVSSEKGGKVKCVVRARRPSGLLPPATLRPFKGYLAIASSTGTGGMQHSGIAELAIFNTSAVGPKSAPRPVLRASAHDVAAALGYALPDYDEEGAAMLAGLQTFVEGAGHDADAHGAAFAGTPALACGKGRLLALPVGRGDIVATFSSELPVAQPPNFNAKLWQSPVLVVAMCLVGLWQFYQKRRGAAGLGGGIRGAHMGGGFDREAFAAMSDADDMGDRYGNPREAMRSAGEGGFEGGSARYAHFGAGTATKGSQRGRRAADRFASYDRRAMAEYARRGPGRGGGGFSGLD